MTTLDIKKWLFWYTISQWRILGSWNIVRNPCQMWHFVEAKVAYRKMRPHKVRAHNEKISRRGKNSNINKYLDVLIFHLTSQCLHNSRKNKTINISTAHCQSFTRHHINVSSQQFGFLTLFTFCTKLMFI